MANSRKNEFILNKLQKDDPAAFYDYIVGANERYKGLGVENYIEGIRTGKIRPRKYVRSKCDWMYPDEGLSSVSDSVIDFLLGHPSLYEVSTLTFYGDIFSRRDLAYHGDKSPKGEYCGVVYCLDKPHQDMRNDIMRELYKSGDEKYWTVNKKEMRVRNKIQCQRDASAILLKEYNIRVQPTRQYIITAEMDYMAKLEQKMPKNNLFYIMAPISYAGNHRDTDSARFLYAIALEIDDLRKENGRPLGMMYLFQKIKMGLLPRPSYIVSSGHGIHLYFLLTNPVPLFKRNAQLIDKLRRNLVKMFWHGDITYDFKQIQYESIYQGFRMPGSRTKRGLDENIPDLARVFSVGQGKDIAVYDIDELFSYCDNIKAKDFIKLPALNAEHLTREELKKAYPEWYDKNFDSKGKKRENVEPPKRGHWVVKRAFYESYKKRVLEEVRHGTRFHALRMLRSVALKCGLSEAEIENELYEVGQSFIDTPKFKLLDGVEENEEDFEPFKMSDIIDAISQSQSYDDEDIIRYGREVIYENAGMIPPPENKRNFLKQDVHLAIARASQKSRDEILKTNWRQGCGRKPKSFEVIEWKFNNPDGSKYRCIKETGLDKKTVYKWWDWDNTYEGHLAIQELEYQKFKAETDAQFDEYERKLEEEDNE